MNKPWRTGTAVASALLILMPIAAGGCQLLVDPFTDEFANSPAVTTPSVQVVPKGPGDRQAVRRPYEPPIRVTTMEGTVTHGVLYFEDPFEDKGSEDGEFSWTGEDYLYVFYGPGRFLLNSVFFPVSAVVTPPCTVMASDGFLSRQALGMDHDAERWGDTSPTG